ncbi:uncharacterized protein ACO6RY_16133 [Pungitius sinensis]
MALVQAYKAELLADVAEELTAEVVRELRHTADLALRATKETAKSVGRSMGALLATERHLLVSQSNMRDKSFLLYAPLSPSALFGDAIDTVVDRFHNERRQAAAFNKFLPRRSPGCR